MVKARAIIALAALGALAAASCTAPRMTMLLHNSKQPSPMSVLESKTWRQGERVHVELRAVISAGYEGAVTALVSLDGECDKHAKASVDFDRPFPPHATESILTNELVSVRCGAVTTLRGSLWGRSAFVWGWALIEPFVIFFHDLELKESTAH